MEEEEEEESKEMAYIGQLELGQTRFLFGSYYFCSSCTLFNLVLFLGIGSTSSHSNVFQVSFLYHTSLFPDHPTNPIFTYL